MRERGYDGPLWRIPMAAWPVAAGRGRRRRGRAALRRVRAHERVEAHPAAAPRIRALPRLAIPGARLVLAGLGATRRSSSNGGSSRPASADAVVREDYVPEERLWALLRRVDAAIALRAPTMGETSAIVIRALSVGTPLVVSDVGWFSELPDDVALKVAPDEREVETRSSPHSRRFRRPACARRWARVHASSRDASTTSSASRISTPPRSRRPRALRRSAAHALDRCERDARRRRRARASRAPFPRGRGSPAIVAVSAGDSLRARARDGRAVDHGRRARLLRAREELRGDTATSSFAASRPAARTASSIRC